MMNRTRGTLLGTRIGLADRWWQRVRGYLKKPQPQLGEGLLMVPCRVVHMFGMDYSLDVLFLDRAGRVVELYEELQPGQKTRVVRDGAYALELPTGTIQVSGTQKGDLMSWTPVDEIQSVTQRGPKSNKKPRHRRRRNDRMATTPTVKMGAHR